MLDYKQETYDAKDIVNHIRETYGSTKSLKKKIQKKKKKKKKDPRLEYMYK